MVLERPQAFLKFKRSPSQAGKQSAIFDEVKLFMSSKFDADELKLGARLFILQELLSRA